MPPRATVRLLPDPESTAPSFGPCRSIQRAELQANPEFVAQLWTAESLERLARAYWAYLEKISRGLLRVDYEPRARTVMLLRRVPLLRFGGPDYEMGATLGRVTWPLQEGVLVAREGRGQGFLRIEVRRAGRTSAGDNELVEIAAEVANFYPLLRGRGRAAVLGTRLYSATQLRLHVLITHGFLRSLSGLELPESAVGSFRAAAAATTEKAPVNRPL